MVQPKKRGAKPSKTLTDFKVIFNPVFLPEDENDERINRLAEQILECVKTAKQKQKGKRQRSGEFTETIFAEDYDALFGLV